MVTTSIEHRHLCYSRRWLHRGNMGKEWYGTGGGVVTTSTLHRNLCYSRRWLHRGNMGKGFGMKQKGSHNNVYRAQKLLLQQQKAP